MYIEESFDITFNMGYGTGKSAMDESVNFIVWRGILSHVNGLNHPSTGSNTALLKDMHISFLVIIMRYVITPVMVLFYQIITPMFFLPR